MEILKIIEQDFKRAMEQGQRETLATLRLLKASLQNKEIELRPKKQKLNDEMAMEVIQREIKKRREAIEMFEKGGRNDLAEKEKKEAEILSKYLPEQLSDEEIRKVVLRTIQTFGAVGPQDLGRVIGKAMLELKGRAEGNKVREIIKKELEQIKN